MGDFTISHRNKRLSLPSSQDKYARQARAYNFLSPSNFKIMEKPKSALKIKVYSSPLVFIASAVTGQGEVAH